MQICSEQEALRRESAAYLRSVHQEKFEKDQRADIQKNTNKKYPVSL